MVIPTAPQPPQAPIRDQPIHIIDRTVTNDQNDTVISIQLINIYIDIYIYIYIYI